MPGCDHGATYEGAITPALAKLVSCATPERRSTTVTSWPSRRRKYAVVTPMMPAPMTTMRIDQSFICDGRNVTSAGKNQIARTANTIIRK